MRRRRRRPGETSRAPRWVAGLGACVLGASVLGCTDSAGPPPEGGPVDPVAGPRAGERVAGEVRALADLERAVRRRDSSLLTPPSAPGPRRRLLAVVRNAAALDARGFEVRHLGGRGAGSSGADPTDPTDHAWAAPVQVSWRLARLEPEPTVVRMRARFEARGARVVLVSLTRVPGGRQPVWLAGPVRARSSARTLVLAARGQPVAGHARRARGALAVVRRVLPRWHGPLVVEVPRDERALEAALGAPRGSYAGIAAVTTAAGDEGAAPQHVLVNPDVLGALGPRGAQVVLSHEATHVALGGDPAVGAPPWLREGFADYVALRGIDLPLRVTAAQVIDRVRRDGLPDRLPGRAAMAADAPDLGAAYEAAWLACLVVVERAGERALVGLQRDVARGDDLEEALRARTGWRVADLRGAWRSRLRTIASPVATSPRRG